MDEDLIPIPISDADIIGADMNNEETNMLRDNVYYLKNIRISSLFI